MSIIKVDPFRSGIRFGVGDFTPRVDIAETETSITVHAELPGIDKKDVKITVNNGNILTISGEKKRESRSENLDKNYMRIERSYGSFARSFTLPDSVAAENINAAFENGVLNITIPKKEPAKPKELEVTIQ
jgi:HSP20 family protein